MTRRAAGLAAAVGLGVAAVIAAAAPGSPDTVAVCDPLRVTLGTRSAEVSFAIEIADEPQEQSRGLMFRPSLSREAGMLFIYDPPQPAAFWMKNTMISLDMIFIDDAGVVRNIEAEADPYTLTVRRSDGPVRAVLEINGGLSAELGIEAGSQLIHPAFRSAAEPYRCPPGS
ncbi:MAG: DUF192 domain-containing protein [Pseudomonadota bacterium]